MSCIMLQFSHTVQTYSNFAGRKPDMTDPYRSLQCSSAVLLEIMHLDIRLSFGLGVPTLRRPDVRVALSDGSGKL